ncbi:MAG: hypothetical protein IJ719_10075 [Clostridia bacterium]|nr:hypothetical protein [Clostridia bacterium]
MDWRAPVAKHSGYIKVIWKIPRGIQQGLRYHGSVLRWYPKMNWMNEEKMTICKAMEDHNKKLMVQGYIKAFKKVFGNNASDIIKAVSEEFQVTPEYVINIMNAMSNEDIKKE